MTRKTPVVLALLILLGCFAASDQTPVVAEGPSYLLSENQEVGTVRMVQASRALATTLTFSPGQPYATSTSFEQNHVAVVHEWTTAMAGERVSEVWRSYRDITTTRTETVDYGNGPEKISTPVPDVRQHQTFKLKVNADNSRTINHATWEFITQSDRNRVQLDKDVDLLPGRSVKVGDSWKVPPERLGLIAVSSPDEKLTSTDFKVTFSDVRSDDDGNQYADLAVAATLKFTTNIVSEFGAEYNTELTSSSTLEGTALFNISAGQMVSYDWKGQSQIGGKMNGNPISAAVEFAEANVYQYAFVSDKPVNNEDTTPVEATEMKAEKSGAVAAGNILIGRNNGKRSLIQVFNPTTKKVVKTLLTLPGGVSIANLALSPDRKRVAFSSNLNYAISVAKADVFVLELETGTINQVSPHWADNKGIAKPIKTAKTTTITGRIIWKDDDPKNRRDRHDGFTGSVRIDQTSCVGVVKLDGTFKVTGVPVGVAVVMDIHGILPSFSDGKSRGALAQVAGITTTLLLDENEKNLGDVRISGFHTETVYDRPCWQGDTVWINQSAWTRAFKAGYKTRSWDAVDFGNELQLLFGGFTVSRDGKYAAFCRDSSGGAGGVHFFTTDGKPVWNSLIKGATLDFTAEGLWTSQGQWVCTARIDNTLGKTTYGGPALVVADLAGKQAVVPRVWPQLAGHNMLSLATDENSQFAYFVTHKYVQETGLTLGDLWGWDSETDTLSRLTSLNDLVAVASYGR
ncbi:MAG: hypothetical protein KDB68_03935 [Planctomycetes bacterium]|nr:hypothetical protein [Planctomycetota bacterium]MCA8935332.1 hypothetical protein [Planctomycetota bacterium]